MVDALRPPASAPPGGPPLMSSTSVVAVAEPAASTPRGFAIDVFNFGGGRCRTCRQHPPGGPPSTSSISVVAAAGPAARALHRHLQLRWWLLSDLPPAPPRGPSSTSSTSVVASMFLSVDGGRSRTFSSGTSRGPTVDVS
jgi:hypothetical protein